MDPMSALKLSDVSNTCNTSDQDIVKSMDFHTWGPRKKTIHIAGFDGGGPRGIMSAMIAAKIEEITGIPFSDGYKTIAGTSVGSFIAAGLNFRKPGEPNQPPYKAIEMVELFEKETVNIFPSASLLSRMGSIFWSTYKSAGLDRVLGEYFKDTLLCDALNTIYIPACELTTAKPWWFSNSKIEFVTNPKESDNFKTTISDEEFKTVKLFNVLKTSSAAPTYFDPEEMTFKNRKYSLRDGGIFANNPSVYASIETFKKYGPSCKFSLTSFGTGTVTEESWQESQNNRGLYFWGSYFPSVSMEMTAKNNKMLMKSLFPLEGQDQNLFIFQPEISVDDYTTDGSSKEHMERLKEAANACMEEQSDKLVQLCGNLLDEANAKDEDRTQLKEF